MELLSQLTTMGDVSRSEFEKRFEEIGQSGDHRILVAEEVDSKRLVATATMLIERKFIHRCGKVGHVEDVVVDETCRGCGIGRRVMEELMRWAESQGCYKVILDCAEENAGFYEKCGMKRKEIQMVKYF